jgi:very-short-patch-repair endonuclease
MLSRMFDRRCAGYEAVGYTLLLPARALPGWPADVPLPIDSQCKNDYAASVQRLIRDGVDTPLATLFLRVTHPPSADVTGLERARSASEAFLFRRLETLPTLAGKFHLNTKLPIPFDGFSEMEIDLLCDAHRIAIEIDGPQHLTPEHYRHARRKDALLQANGYIILRFLADDLGKHLDAVLDAVELVMTGRRG